jgi:hypothetical protein
MSKLVLARQGNTVPEPAGRAVLFCFFEKVKNSTLYMFFLLSIKE